MRDVDEYLSFWNDPEVMKYIGDGTWGGDEKVVKKLLQTYLLDYAKNPDLGFWAVIEKQSKRLIGEAGLQKIATTNEIEAGYIFAKAYWGQGFATEVLQALLDYGFKKLKLAEIIALAHPANKASENVMKKCGMIYVGKETYYNRLSVKYTINSNNPDKS